MVVSSASKIVQIELIDDKKETFATIGKNSQKRVGAGQETQRQRLKLKNTERLIGL